jgi:MYXO-CTERM domain-containing protein
MKKFVLATLVYCTFVCALASADSISLDFTSGGFEAESLGNMVKNGETKKYGWTSEFDKVNVLDMAGTVSLESGQTNTFLINQFTFEAGPTGNSSMGKTFTFETTRSFTINGATQDLAQDFSLNIGDWSGDDLNFLSGGAVEFASDNMTVTVTPLATASYTSDGRVVTGNLYASFALQQTAATPEASSLAMAAMGMLALAGYGWSRRQRVAA